MRGTGSGLAIPRPNNPLELTAHSAGFVGYSWRFLLWAAAQRKRWRGRFAPRQRSPRPSAARRPAQSAGQHVARADSSSGEQAHLRFRRSAAGSVSRP
jgi:hypothetical protein